MNISKWIWICIALLSSASVLAANLTLEGLTNSYDYDFVDGPNL